MSRLITARPKKLARIVIHDENLNAERNYMLGASISARASGIIKPRPKASLQTRLDRPLGR